MKTHTTGAGQRRISLALAIAACACATSAFGADATGASFATVAHPTTLDRGDAVMGALPMGEPVHIVVGLKLRNKAALDAFVANNAASQAHGIPAQQMTPEQILADHAPTQAQAQRVADYLTRSGFSNIVIEPNRLLVSADGTAANARNAFMTSLAQVRTHEGRIAFANTDDIRIPAALTDTVQTVLGLQTVHRFHTFVHLAPTHDVRTNAVHTDDAVTEAVPGSWYTSIYGTYGFGGAATTPIGIFSQGDLTQVLIDLQASYGQLRKIPTQVVKIRASSTDTSNSIEYTIDSQAIAGVTGQALTSSNVLDKLMFFDVPTLNFGDITLGMNRVLAYPTTKVINFSLGACETGTGSVQLTEDPILELSVAQGQTYSVSTGDSGADECGDGGTTPAYPASSPYVVAVAGTTVTVDDDGTGHGSGPGGLPGYFGEVVWNELSTGTGATGGSQSTLEPKPAWQTLWSGPNRGVADVAFDAAYASAMILDFRCIPTCQTAAAFGTSLAAPIFSGIWATVLSAKHNNAFGFAGPVIYALPASDFHDITTGNNDGESAAVGYDLASGRGSLIFSSQLIADTAGLGNQTPVPNFTFVTSALTADFTDTSTDDGGIYKRAWTFGDGGTSTLANPSHTYATAGTYAVKETVTDGPGLSKARLRNVTVTNVGAQFLKNTGFETGVASPWTIPAGALIENSGQAHSGSWFVSLGGGNSLTQHIAQTVKIPAGYVSASLAFWLNTTTQETGTAVHDKLTVSVYSTSGTLLATLATYSNLNPTAGYALQTLDMTPYIGQSVMVNFNGFNNVSLPTTWSIDDVTLTAQ